MSNARSAAKRVTWSVDGGNQSGGHSSAAMSCSGALGTIPAAHEQLNPTAERVVASSIEQLCLGGTSGKAQLAELECAGSCSQNRWDEFVHCCTEINCRSLDGALPHTKLQPLSACTCDSTNISSEGTLISQQQLQPSAIVATAAAEFVPFGSTVSLLSLGSSTPCKDTFDSVGYQKAAGQARASLTSCDLMLPAATAAIPRIATPAAAALAVSEAPWTQNTARALRRAQQEVKELFVAQGLPPSAEKPCCFDLVGTRAAGIAAGTHCSAPATTQLQRDWPVVEGLVMASRSPATPSNSGGGDSGQVSSSGTLYSGDGTAMGLSSQGMTPVLQHQGNNKCFPGLTVETPSSCHTPNTPASPAAQLLLELQQRRGHCCAALWDNTVEWTSTSRGRQQAAGAGPKALPGQQPKQHSAGKLVCTQQCKQPWDRLFARHHLAEKPNQTREAAASRHYTAMPHSSRKRPSVQKYALKRAGSSGACSSVLQLDATLMVRAEHSLALHSLLASNQDTSDCCHSPVPRSSSASECCCSSKHSTPDEGHLQCQAQQSAPPTLLPTGRSTTADAGHRGDRASRTAKSVPSVLCDLPYRWWTTADRPLSDPLLLAMPVWMRDALDLELMPL